MAFVARVVRIDRTALGVLFTVALQVDGRYVGEVLLVVVRHRGASTRALLFDLEVRGGWQVSLGRA